MADLPCEERVCQVKMAKLAIPRSTARVQDRPRSVVRQPEVSGDRDAEHQPEVSSDRIAEHQPEVSRDRVAERQPEVSGDRVAERQPLAVLSGHGGGDHAATEHECRRGDEADRREPWLRRDTDEPSLRGKAMD